MPNTSKDTNELDNKILQSKIEHWKSTGLQGWKWNKIMGIKFDFAEERKEIKTAILGNLMFNSCGHFLGGGGGTRAYYKRQCTNGFSRLFRSIC